MGSAGSFGRRIILKMADSRWMRRFMNRHGLRLGARRFVAGLNLDEAMARVLEINDEGLKVTLDHLGESVRDGEAARQAAGDYLDMLRGIADAGADANISLKLTQFGLAFDHGLAEQNLRRVAEKARDMGNFVRIDMEDTPYTDITLELFRKLRADGLDNLGVVIQSYLYRSDDDLEKLAEERVNVRLVKGAYDEPPDLAYPRKKDVDAAFKRHIAYYLDNGPYTAIATHDEDAISFSIDHIESKGISGDKYEFQMLYGIRDGLQRDLARRGYTVRVYVPFGLDWYPYFMRRLAERPANIGFLMRSFFRR